MKLAKSMKKEVLDLVFEDAKRMSEETRSVVETHIKLKNTISPQPWVSSDGILVTTPEGQQIYTYEAYLESQGYQAWFFGAFPTGRIVAMDCENNPRLVNGQILYGVELFDGEGNLLSRGYGMESQLSFAKLAALKSAMADAGFGGLDFSAIRVGLPKYIFADKEAVRYEGPFTYEGCLYEKEEPAPKAVEEPPLPSEKAGKSRKEKPVPAITEWIKEKNEEKASAAPANLGEAKSEGEETALTKDSAKEVIFSLLPGIEPGTLSKHLGKPMGEVDPGLIRTISAPTYRSRIAPGKFPANVIEAAVILAS